MIEPRRYWIASKERLAQVVREIERLDVGPGRVLEVIARPARKEKTVDQRRLFHAVCGDIGLELGNSPGQVKYAIKVDFYGLDEFRVGDQTFFDVQSSEESDRAEYSRLIDHAYLWAAERGVLIQDRRRPAETHKEG